MAVIRTVTAVVLSCAGVRKLRVWNRECILQYTSPDVSGLEQALAWK